MATSEHIAAVARTADPEAFEDRTPPTSERMRHVWEVQWAARRKMATDLAAAVLDSTDPAVHAAMLDALVRAGVLNVEEHKGHVLCEPEPVFVQRRYVTEWTADA